MTRYRATLAYDGTAYVGFQRQADGLHSVQSVVEKTITRVTQTRGIVVRGAGRTDAGVHAEGQVIAFDTAWRHSIDALQRAVNVALPEDISLLTLAEAAPDFHPRFDARSRVYRYQVYQAETRHPLWARTAWQVRGALDKAVMDEAAALILGTHDFLAFGSPPDGKSNSIRTVIASGWTDEAVPYGHLWTYRIEANAFLQHMVRRIVGLWVMIGRGERPLETLHEGLRLEFSPRMRRVAPAHGLCLEQVRYEADEMTARG